MSKLGVFGPKFASYLKRGPSDKSTLPTSFVFCGSIYFANLLFACTIVDFSFLIVHAEKNNTEIIDKIRREQIFFIYKSSKANL